LLIKKADSRAADSRVTDSIMAQKQHQKLLLLPKGAINRAIKSKQLLRDKQKEIAELLS
jgi:hypothetical protein